MHTNTLSQSGPSTYRLFVAVPLFALCFAVSMGDGLWQGSVSEDESVSTITAGVSGSVIDTGVAAMGDAVFLLSGSQIHLTHGSALVAAHAAVTLHVGDTTFTTWNGAFDVHVADDALTIAALTSPVLIKQAEGRWIVPVGMQMYMDENITDRSASLVLPAHYRAERLPLAEQAMNRAMSDHRTIPAAFAPSGGRMFMLAAARARAEEQERIDLLQELMQMLLAGDRDHVQRALQDELMRAALRSPASKSFMPWLMSRALRLDTPPLLLPFFLADEDMHLIAAYHPSIREHVWVLPWENVSMQYKLLALLQLPASDDGMNGMPGIAIEQWGNEWEAMLQEHHDSATIDTMLLRLEAAIHGLEESGYPERSRLYAHVVIDAFSAYASSDVSRGELERLTRLVGGEQVVIAPVVVEQEIDASSPSSTDAASVLPDAETALHLQEKARNILQSRGAMFTVQTTFAVQSRNRVRIEHVVFETPRGDQLLSFTYDVAADTVVDIEKDGEILPYSVPLEQYLEWVGKSPTL